MLNEIRAASGEGSRRPARATAGEVAPAGSTPPRVLIVEDELFVAWHLESIVQDLRFDVCAIVPNAEQALARARAADVDVILMDINLGAGMDGIETARRMRQRAPRPVVFVTAYGDEQMLRRVNAAVPGAPVVIKPVTAEALRAAIMTALKKAQ
jgi:two-component system, response regulator PdtaR